MSDNDVTAPLGPPPRDGRLFRATLGLTCVFGGLVGLGLLYFVEVPAGNREPLLLALGIVLGWGGSVVASEYGASTTGRKLAEATIDRAAK